MCKQHTTVPFHLKMRSDAVMKHPIQGVKRSNTSQAARPAPANRKNKAEHSNAKTDNGRQSPASPRVRQGSRPPTGSPKCDSPNGAKQGRKTSTPSRPPPPPLGNSPSNYAGAKFSEPPSPKMLPKPPTSWMMNKENEEVVIDNDGSCSQMTSVLRVMLNVQA